MTDTARGATGGTGGWPLARLDPIARLRAIEARQPGVVGQERVLDAPFDAVWAWIADLERSVPEFDASVTRLSVRSRRGPDLDVRAWTATPVPIPFRVRLEDGFCLMQGKARLYLVGMAAVPEGDRTRFRHAEGVPLPGLGRLARPLVRREVASDLQGMVRHFAADR